jgi:DNA integrity scanning protein DisA with diadenylate cyclase activity
MMAQGRSETSFATDEELLGKELEELRSHLLRIQGGLSSLKKCSRLHALLQRVFEVREELNALEQGLLQTHLRCCISPGINVSGEVVLAVSQLSSKRHGAIIVIEQKNDLDGFVEGGSIIDAAVCAPVLESLFYPGSPLHDGAVVIRNNRIHRAGCFLPLAAHSSGLDTLGLGTRHRAAVGVSQLSDAIVIVISEEKGWISVALGGHLYPNLGIFALVKRLGAIEADDRGREEK